MALPFKQETEHRHQMQSPLFAPEKRNSINSFHKLHRYTLLSSRLPPNRTHYSTLPMARAGSSLGRDPHQYGISNTSTDYNLTNNVHGDSNTNVGNVLNSYNNTINVGVDEESLRIQAWLSPLKPDIRHEDVSNSRMEGIGDWVLQRNEFESWYGSQDGSGDPTLLCYGGQGVGKTFIRYHILPGPIGNANKWPNQFIGDRQPTISYLWKE